MPPSDSYILSAFSSEVFPEPWEGSRDGLLRTKDISLNKLTVPSHSFSLFFHLICIGVTQSLCTLQTVASELPNK